MEKIGVIWFRQDLRLDDNYALNEICKACDYVLPIYIFDKNNKIGSASKWWLEKSLYNLKKSLESKESKIILYKDNPKVIISDLISKMNITHFFWNRSYDYYSVERDKKLKKYLIEKNIICKTFKGSLINEPWDIKNNNNEFYKVFTPYWNKSLEKIKNSNLFKAPSLIPFPKNKLNFENLSIKDLNLISEKSKSNWTHKFEKECSPGEFEAKKRLNNFKKNILDEYGNGRDRPDKNFTSKLSPYLHFGEISPERIFFEIKNFKNKNRQSKNKYLSEIGWREFSYNLIYYYPDMDKVPIQKKFLKFPWKKNLKHLKAWQEGMTGIPIIDAGMRQLYKTGWMHNRLRMIVGSFLCKNLLIHWSEGEKWFFDKLVDADIASNSAGWQWIAGCGADAAPYFRVFNPFLQSKKFDPDGLYIKKYVPELSLLPSILLHSPLDISIEDQLKYKCIIGKDYPKPIIDIYKTRDIALDSFKSLKN